MATKQKQRGRTTRSKPAEPKLVAVVLPVGALMDRRLRNSVVHGPR